ncbi:lipase family protein, partial [Helicobacter saguini]
MKQIVSDLKDYAELAWASYFYFDLEKYVLQKNDNMVTLYEIINLNYKGRMAGKKEKIGKEYYFVSKDKLNGEFGELQAQNFAKRYQIYFHQPNTKSGFSATLFYDTQKDRFVVGFRGTEEAMDIIQDIALSSNVNLQSFALLDFLKEVNQFIKIYNKRIIFVGHSLGGYLAQMALIYCDKKYKDELSFSPNEVYTFNSPSIYGWNLPNIAMNPNTIKILLDFLNKNIVDTSANLTHVYNNGGIKIIASAQYGSINRIPIYTGFNSHSIIPLTQTLYFHSYLLESSINDSIFQNNIHDILNALNSIVKSIYNILYNIEINKALQEGDYDDNNPISVNNPPHWLYATIDKTLFEATSKTNDNKKLIKNDASDVIDGILYLQDNEIYIKILSKNEIININIS